MPQNSCSILSYAGQHNYELGVTGSTWYFLSNLLPSSQRRSQACRRRIGSPSSTVIFALHVLLFALAAPVGIEPLGPPGSERESYADLPVNEDGSVDLYFGPTPPP